MNSQNSNIKLVCVLVFFVLNLFSCNLLNEAHFVPFGSGTLNSPIDRVLAVSPMSGYSLVADHSTSKLKLLNKNGEEVDSAGYGGIRPVAVSSVFTGNVLEYANNHPDYFLNDDRDSANVFAVLFENGGLVFITTARDDTTGVIALNAIYTGDVPDPADYPSSLSFDFHDIGVTQEGRVYVCGGRQPTVSGTGTGILAYRDDNFTWQVTILPNKCTSLAPDQYGQDDSLYVYLENDTIVHYQGLQSVNTVSVGGGQTVLDMAAADDHVVVGIKDSSDPNPLSVEIWQINSSSKSTVFSRKVNYISALDVQGVDADHGFIWHLGADAISSGGMSRSYYLHRYGFAQ